jgi:hypothetical protein
MTIQNQKVEDPSMSFLLRRQAMVLFVFFFHQLLSHHSHRQHQLGVLILQFLPPAYPEESTAGAICSV